MENIDLITSIGQLGLNGVLIVILFALWKEFREQNAFIRDLLLEGEAERRVMAEQIGLTTQDLKQQALVVRRRMARENLYDDKPN